MRCFVQFEIIFTIFTKSAHGGVLLLVKMQFQPATLKVTLLHGCFSTFLDFTSSTKLRKVAQMIIYLF